MLELICLKFSLANFLTSCTLTNLGKIPSAVITEVIVVVPITGSKVAVVQL
jgi:hypothetical protein